MIVTFTSTGKGNRHFHSWIYVSPSLVLVRAGKTNADGWLPQQLLNFLFWGYATDLDGTFQNNWITGIITFTKSAQLKLNCAESLWLRPKILDSMFKLCLCNFIPIRFCPVIFSLYVFVLSSIKLDLQILPQRSVVMI